LDGKSASLMKSSLQIASMLAIKLQDCVPRLVGCCAFNRLQDLEQATILDGSYDNNQYER
jgi:hypothetical protein